MTTPDETLIQELMRAEYDPCSISAGVPLSIVVMGLVNKVDVSPDGAVHVQTRLATPGRIEGSIKFTNEIEARGGALEHVREIWVDFDNSREWSEAELSEVARTRIESRRKHAPSD